MSSSKNPILHTLLSLTGDPNTITVHRAVVDFLEGRFEAALLLEQLLYWTPKATKRGGWIAKSYTEWQEEIFLTRYAVEKARKYLKSRGLVEWEVRRFNNSPTAFYRVNLDALAQAWEAFLGERGEVEPLDEGVSTSESQPKITKEAPAEIDRWSEEAKKAPAEINRCPEEPSKAPVEISKPPDEIDRSPAEISKSLTEITTEITQLTRKRKLTATTTATVNRGEHPQTRAAAVAAASNMPNEIRDALKALGWTGSMGEVAAAWQQDPARVRAWVEYAQRKRWSAALLRAMLREDPGYPPREPDPAERYLGDYPPPDDAPETRADAPSSPAPPPDLPAPVRQWWRVVQEQLRMEMPKAAFDTWVRPAFPLAFADANGGEGNAVLTVAAVNDYAQRWLTERLTKILERKLAGLAGHPVTVQFVVLEDVHA